MGADHAASPQRSSLDVSVGSTLGEGWIKDVVLCHDLRGFQSLGASPEAFDLLLPTARRCHPALPRDCLGSFGGRLGALLGHLGNVLLFFWVGKQGCLLLADVSRQRRQVLSFQEVKISDAGFRAARDHGVRNYVRY